MDWLKTKAPIWKLESSKKKSLGQENQDKKAQTNG